jgi:ribosomal protein S18
MKDAFKEYGDVHEYRKKVETRESDMERDLLATRAHLNRVLAMIPPENAQQIISHADQATKAWQREQKDMVLETIPAWRDDAVRLADRQAINEHGAEYGFSVEEMEYTHDARMLRYMHDFAKLKQEVAEMRTGAKKKTVSADAPKRRAGATKQRKLAQAIRRARESTNVSDKRAVVSQLITGG